MGKFLSFIFLTLSLCLVFTGCTTSNQSPNLYLTEWTEVKSIIYYLNNDTRSETKSTYQLTVQTPELITSEEYNNAPNNKKVSISGDVGQYKNKIHSPFSSTYIQISELKNNYIYYSSYGSYYKAYCTDYVINYTKVRLCNNGAIEIQYGDGTISMVNALSYSIQYFAD